MIRELIILGEGDQVFASMRGFNIATVTSPSPREAAKAFSDLGIDLTKELGGILATEVTMVSALALAAAQSAVPVRTGELREAIKQVANSPYEHEIYMENTIHESSNTRFKLNNPTLAEILDEGYCREIVHPSVIRPANRRVTNGRRFRRTRNSQGVPPFYSIFAGQPTANWIAEARRNVDEAAEY